MCRRRVVFSIPGSQSYDSFAEDLDFIMAHSHAHPTTAVGEFPGIALLTRVQQRLFEVWHSGARSDEPVQIQLLEEFTRAHRRYTDHHILNMPGILSFWEMATPPQLNRRMIREYQEGREATLHPGSFPGAEWYISLAIARFVMIPHGQHFHVPHHL